jgi:hypothetical protein
MFDSYSLWASLNKLIGIQPPEVKVLFSIEKSYP